jgi:hypothetical protein
MWYYCVRLIPKIPLLAWERDSCMRFNLLMLACDIPLCLSGKVKIKTVKVECVSQHVVYQFVVGVYMQALTLCWQYAAFAFVLQAFATLQLFKQSL